MAFPWMAAAMAANAALNFGSNFVPMGGVEGALVDDQRFMNDFAWKQSLRNEDFQKQLATHGIRMRVADAEAAGLHPLVAAGVNPAGGNPVSVNFTGGAGGSGGSRWANAMAGMGQDITRAAMATATQEERAESKARVASMEASTEEAKVRKQVAMAELERLKNPPMPSAYQLYQMPDGSSMMYYTPEFANAIQADPLQMYGASWENVFTGRSTGGLDLNHGQIRGPYRGQYQKDFYRRNK